MAITVGRWAIGTVGRATPRPEPAASGDIFTHACCVRRGLRPYSSNVTVTAASGQEIFREFCPGPGPIMPPANTYLPTNKRALHRR